MAHELSFAKNGEAEMAFVGQVPWHGLGQELRHGASIEQWASAAHMDWEILRAVVTYSVMSDQLMAERKMVTDRHVLYRSDNQNPLSIVSDSYKIVQPRDVLEFYRSLVDTAGLELETAGVLFGGKRFWALANTGRSTMLAGKDEVKGYLLLSTSCDGTLATSAQFTSIRVVCNNTLSIAVGDKSASKVRVPHNRVWNPDEVKTQLGFIDRCWEQFRENIELLSKKKIDRSLAAQYLVDLFGDPELPVDQQSPAVADKCAHIWELYQGAGLGADMTSSKGTAWGLLNAITQTIDYHTSHHTVDARLNSAWFGSGAATKTKAFELALTSL
jgi:phage/plasmid-like protein (TIGR03299 family)